MQKKLLILNGSHSDIPLIEAGKELGYYVITSGNKPELIGHKYADRYINADFSDYELMAKIAEEENIDAVCACANDFGAITAAYISEKLGLPGHDKFETALDLHHKDRFKRIAKKIGLLTPQAEGFSNEREAIDYANSLDYEVIIKPVDLTGGKGISRAISADEKEESIKNAFARSVQKRVVIEPFIKGTYHSFSTFIVNKKVAFSFSDNEYSVGSKYYVSTSAGPADRIEETKGILISQTEKLCDYLNLTDGRLHLQYVMDSEGKPYILEYSRRCSGDLYSEPESRALGFNTAIWIVKAECGIDCSDYPNNVYQKGFVGRHNLVAPYAGKIKNVHIDEKLLSHVYSQLMWWNPGYEITNVGTDKVGIIQYETDSKEEMVSLVRNIPKQIKFEYY